MGFEGDDGNEESDPITASPSRHGCSQSMDISFKEAVSSGVTSVITAGKCKSDAGQMLAVKTFGHRLKYVILQSASMQISFR